MYTLQMALTLTLLIVPMISTDYNPSDEYRTNVYPTLLIKLTLSTNDDTTDVYAVDCSICPLVQFVLEPVHCFSNQYNIS